ncbi:hypothetical protein V3481_018229 [Fusarium oxysporum f. sp. vasinfectum]
MIQQQNILLNHLDNHTPQSSIFAERRSVHLLRRLRKVVDPNIATLDFTFKFALRCILQAFYYVLHP